MSSPDTRRLPRLKEESPPILERLDWRVRSVDGKVRGPLSVEGIRSLFEVGVIDARCSVAAVAEERWTRLPAHRIWEDVRPSKREFAFRDNGSLPPIAEASPSYPMIPLLPETRAHFENARQVERIEAERRLSLWKMRGVLRVVREVLVVLTFFTVGDVLTAFCGGAVDGQNWMIGVGLLSVGVVYYTLRLIGSR